MTYAMQVELTPGKIAPDALLRPRQVEQVFPITANHLAQLRHQRRGPRYMRHGHLIAYRAGDVQDWLMSGLVEPEDATPRKCSRKSKASA
ncbi:hypothetical protein [Mycobacteroides abscessus]|uniref:hypothetical protein n=1 Tax=Mycobacteroides abscessus TaxID=36809 RepID=UPI001F2ADF4A|nr:hypothetical protein [Mycobacteroides abscessus]